MTRTRTVYTIGRKPKAVKLVETRCPSCRCWRSATRCCACGKRHE